MGQSCFNMRGIPIILNDYQPNKQTNIKQYTKHNAFHARSKYKYLNLGLTVFEIKDDDIALQGNRYNQTDLLF